jgi:hypothetical protein
MEGRNRGVLVLRVLIGFSVLKDFFAYFYCRDYLFNENGIVSYATYQDIINHYKLGVLNIDFTTRLNAVLFCIIGIFFSTTFLLGIFSRISALALFLLLLINKFRNLFMLDGGDNVITAILPLFLFINSESLINSYNKLKEEFRFNTNFYNLQVSNLFVIGIMIQVCIIYFFAGLHKLQGSVWVNGTALYYILNSEDFSIYAINEYITRFPIVVYFSTWFTVAFQLLFPFLVWLSKTRKIVLILGILLHACIFVMMRIDNFSFIMLACYSVFFTDREYEVLIAKTRKIIKI